MYTTSGRDEARRKELEDLKDRIAHLVEDVVTRRELYVLAQNYEAATPLIGIARSLAGMLGRPDPFASDVEGSPTAVPERDPERDRLVHPVGALPPNEYLMRRSYNPNDAEFSGAVVRERLCSRHGPYDVPNPAYPECPGCMRALDTRHFGELADRLIGEIIAVDVPQAKANGERWR